MLIIDDTQTIKRAKKMQAVGKIIMPRGNITTAMPFSRLVFSTEA
jgi:hypothetical protein